MYACRCHPTNALITNAIFIFPVPFWLAHCEGTCQRYTARLHFHREWSPVHTHSHESLLKQDLKKERSTTHRHLLCSCWKRRKASLCICGVYIFRQQILQPTTWHFIVLVFLVRDELSTSSEQVVCEMVVVLNVHLTVVVSTPMSPIIQLTARHQHVVAMMHEPISILHIMTLILIQHRL